MTSNKIPIEIMASESYTNNSKLLKTVINDLSMNSLKRLLLFAAEYPLHETEPVCTGNAEKFAHDLIQQMSKDKTIMVIKKMGGKFAEEDQILSQDMIKEFEQETGLSVTENNKENENVGTKEEV